jgi:hypothetical protein
MSEGPQLTIELIMQHANAMERGMLSIWTVYDKPDDYPTGFIARRYEVGAGTIYATPDTLVGDLETIRAALASASLTKLTKHAKDHANVVESWI